MSGWFRGWAPQKCPKLPPLGRKGVPPPCLALLAVEDGEEAEHEGAAGRGEEAAPVIPHGKVGRHRLDAEKHPWKNRGGGISRRGT